LSRFWTTVLPRSTKKKGDAVEGAPEAWRIWYAGIQTEPNPKKQLAICQKVRRLMQERLVQLSSANSCQLGADEENEIEQALRNLWTIEQNLRKRKPLTE
jgi:hypothetical protein